MTIKLLFICTGNTCRSPIAEGLAKKILGTEVTVSSAGMGAWDGDRASTQALTVMKEWGVDLSGHQARRVTRELLEEADWVIPMTVEQEYRLRALYPEFAGKLRRLGAWGTDGKDISDPYGGSVEVYRQSAREIEDLIFELREQLDRFLRKR